MRLPIRFRLTAWYALLLTTIIAGLGAFLVVQFRRDLRAEVDRDVLASCTEIARGFAGQGAEEFLDVSQTVLPGGGSGSQVLDPGGRVLLTYGDAASTHALLTDSQLGRALAGERLVLTVRAGPDGANFRAVAMPVRRDGRRRVVVAAESLFRVEKSVDRVLVLLLLAGPAALLATALGGWWMARKALLPVQRMTSQAETIGIDRLHDRVAVPPTGDEIAHLAETLNAMLGRLERGVTEKRRLVADASHDLRTPLAVMRSELDVSLRDDDMTPSGRSALGSVRDEVDAMTRTVDNLLTLAQADEGRLGLLTTRVHLHEAIEAAVLSLRPLADAKGVTLDSGGDDVEAVADAERLHQALTNFIDNAIKFATPGGAVSVDAWSGEDEVGVTVSDDGPGIPAQARAHIFDRFYRIDSARGREAGGSGLGLAICQEIASAHGGRLWVESEEGRGSAFTLALPRAPERPPRP